MSSQLVLGRHWRAGCSRRQPKQAAGVRRHCCRGVRAAAAGAADAGSPAPQEGGSSSSSAAPPAELVVASAQVATAQELTPEVQEALQRVAEALTEAETTLENLHTLPSAQLPSQWDELLERVKPALQLLALLGTCFVTHSFGWAVRAAGSLAVALAIGLGGYRKGSLSPSGALAAVAVGWGTLGASFRGGLTLLTFFFASSALTRYKDELKAVDEEHKAGGQRDWRQVACNALVPTALAVAAAYLTGGRDVLLQTTLGRLPVAVTGAFLGYYACCCGDTWASELGQLSEEQPRLITTLRPVRKGTNGGVTLLGLAASLAGGLCMGLTFWLAGAVSPTGVGRAALQQWRLVPLGVAAGLVGSLIDSLLGATIQFSGFNFKTQKITGRPGPDVAHISGFPLLDNNAVNAVSASCTALLAGLAAARLFA